MTLPIELIAAISSVLLVEIFILQTWMVRRLFRVSERQKTLISERSVKRGLRTTLLTLAKRLERLAKARLKDFPEGAEDQDQHED